METHWQPSNIPNHILLYHSNSLLPPIIQARKRVFPNVLINVGASRHLNLQHLTTQANMSTIKQIISTPLRKIQEEQIKAFHVIRALRNRLKHECGEISDTN